MDFLKKKVKKIKMSEKKQKHSDHLLQGRRAGVLRAHEGSLLTDIVIYILIFHARPSSM